MYLTYHSYGQYVLYGWGYEKIDPPNVGEIRKMANIGANAMKKENGGSSYSVGGAAKLLYAASGIFEPKCSNYCKFLSFKLATFYLLHWAFILI